MTTATVTVLNSDQRRFLDAQTQRARAAAQRAAEDALRALAVGEPIRPPYLSDEQNELRLALRDKGRQLGDDTSRAGTSLTNMIHEVAYEQWHRLLFARFLEVNGLLRHSEYRDIPLSLEDCGDLASDLGEPDAWAVAARFASEILPGVFRLTDPAVQVRFAAEHRNALERLLLEIPAEVFTTEDALGWVYQFWQTAEKKRVNDSGVKIGGADLSPVTQLFTENYMVRFLLENSLGAWWTERHPESPLVDSWEYLRRNKDGAPAAGSFNDWPERAADVTVMDPCCGSGHFLVAMFGMLWRMRAEEEGLTPAEAQDAVLSDNLHGLELDPRCMQIATFNVALEAWKQGGFRELPAPQIACSGVPVRAAREDWETLAAGSDELWGLLGRLHGRFREADTLGSLIDPRPSSSEGALIGQDLTVRVQWDEVRSALLKALASENAAETVLGHAAEDVVNAAALLGGVYTLVATNPPYLGANKQSPTLIEFSRAQGGGGTIDLAYLMKERWSRSSRTFAVVLPSEWMVSPRFAEMRLRWLAQDEMRILARLGYGAFQGGLRVNPVLQISNQRIGKGKRDLSLLDVPELSKNPAQKASSLKGEGIDALTYEQIIGSAGSVISTAAGMTGVPLGTIAQCRWGLGAGDGQRFERFLWEVPVIGGVWELLQSSAASDDPLAGRNRIVLWENEGGSMARLAESVKHLNHKAQQWRSGKPFWGKSGIAINRVGQLRVSAYLGDRFSEDCLVVVPNDVRDLDAIWAFARSGELEQVVRAVDRTLAITPGSVRNAPIDIESWRGSARDIEPIPEARSADPTQWLFSGDPAGATHPLQVGVARILGYRWPYQGADELDALTDRDGIAALQALPGESDLSTRLRELLRIAYGLEWSSALERSLVTEAGGKNGRLEDWLRDVFFVQHVKVFENRPFLWHIWDGRKDGFSAIVNYHRLDHNTLEKLAFTLLGSWIERQRHEVAADRPGADARLAAAEDLQGRLRLILDGAPPYDVYVRWKALHEQPIGWSPDLDDGVRLNIRPFVTAGVLRSKVNVHWKKDRGKDIDGSERHNDLHPTLDERRAARRQAKAAE